MANITDNIEEYLISSIGNDESLQLSRNELAKFFKCSPSQINYVLSTRFTPLRGYIVQSKRGGSGCIKLIKILVNEDSMLSKLYTELSEKESLTLSKCSDIVSRLVRDDIVTDREGLIILTCISDKAFLSQDIHVDNLRCQVFKELILQLSRRDIK